MYCQNCKQEFEGKFCPECGTRLLEKPSGATGIDIKLGDANAISGGIHTTDSHNVHNEDRSVHNITNTTVTNLTQVSAQKTETESAQERRVLYLNACKRAYEDNVLEQSEVIELEELRIKLSLDKSTANAILESVRVMSERNARKTALNPIARTKLKILTKNLQKNEVKALIDQIDSLEPLVRKFDHDELSRKYFLVLAALKSEKCIEQYEASMIDSYWKSFWNYLAYIKLGQLTKAENVLISLDRFTDYPEDNMSVLAVAGALMMGNVIEAKEYLNELTGEYTPALQRFVDSIYLLLEPEVAKEMGADENTCAFYLVNFFGQKDPKEKLSALQRWGEDAQNGYPEAQYRLGECYYKGEGVSEDKTKAVKWYLKAAEQGHAEAQYRLGECYYYGRGVSEDETEAVKWYRKAVKQFRKAAEQGDPDAQYRLGECYYFGRGVSEDETEAVKWYRKAVEQFRKAAEQGDPDAQYRLGACYYFGRGVSRDETKAVELVRKAAKQGHAYAQYRLGVFYYYGEGVSEDRTKAVEWYLKAAEQGHAEAQYRLGQCYYYGRGVSKDETEAVKWYRKAAKQGRVVPQGLRKLYIED